jgi:hypothetical protein
MEKQASDCFGWHIRPFRLPPFVILRNCCFKEDSFLP